MQDGPYNDLWPWNYAMVPELLGAGKGFKVRTEQELEVALVTAMEIPDTFCLLDVHLDKLDRSPALERLAARLKGRL